MIRQTLDRAMHGGKITLALIMVAVFTMAFTGVAGASAIPIAGGGMINGGGLSVEVNGAAAGPGGPCINFFTTNNPAGCPPSSPAAFLLTGPSDPIFGTPETTVGITQDFVLALQSGTSYVGGTGFMTINGFSFDITSITVPNQVPCPPATAPGVCAVNDFVATQVDFNTFGIACPAGQSPCGHVSVTFSASGVGYSGPSAALGSTPYTFTWTSQFNNETTTDIMNKANATALGILNSVSFTGQPVTTAAVPEPAAFVLAGLGLLGIGALGRRRRSSTKA